MSDFRTVEEYINHVNETSIPKLRWLQIKTLCDQFPNNAEFGERVRQLIQTKNDY